MLVRDVFASASVVVEADTERDAIDVVFHDLDPACIPWRAGEPDGDGQVAEVRPSGDDAELTSLNVPEPKLEDVKSFSGPM
jgi:hypothetical protein